MQKISIDFFALKFDLFIMHAASIIEQGKIRYKEVCANY